MANSEEHDKWWFCTRHMRVEPADTPCPGKDLLGPYPTREEAAHALDKVRERNEAWDEQELGDRAPVRKPGYPRAREQ